MFTCSFINESDCAFLQPFASHAQTRFCQAVIPADAFPNLRVDIRLPSFGVPELGSHGKNLSVFGGEGFKKCQNRRFSWRRNALSGRALLLILVGNILQPCLASL